MIKKLRDVTDEEYKLWKNKNCNIGPEYKKCKECLFCKVNCSHSSNGSWVVNKELYSDKFLNQKIEVESLSILNKEEKEYLKSVIKPFRNKIYGIKKNDYFISKAQGIIIYLKNEFCDYETIKLPRFEPNTKYIGMELDKMYTLEELGL